MKKLALSSIIFSVALFFYGHAGAQITTPKPSPSASLEQTVGLTKIKVEYSRPGAKGRTIFGGLEDWDKIWRTGANASTKITFSDDVTFAGSKVPAGKYALYTIPNQNEWTIILHKNLEHWGVGEYDKKDDLLRVKAKPQVLKDAVESFTIDFGHFTSTSTQMEIKWQNTLISVPIGVEVDSKVMAQIKANIIDAKEVKPELYAPAATYYLETGKDLNKALVWIDKAIESRKDAFWLVHSKAKILAAMGKKKEAIATAEKSMEMAQSSPRGDYGYVKNNENLIADLKKDKQ